LAELEPDDAARAAFCVATGAELRATVRAQRDDIGERLVRLRGTKRRRCAVADLCNCSLTYSNPVSRTN